MVIPFLLAVMVVMAVATTLVFVLVVRITSEQLRLVVAFVVIGGLVFVILHDVLQMDVVSMFALPDVELVNVLSMTLFAGLSGLQHKLVSELPTSGRSRAVRSGRGSFSASEQVFNVSCRKSAVGCNRRELTRWEGSLSASEQLRLVIAFVVIGGLVFVMLPEVILIDVVFMFVLADIELMNVLSMMLLASLSSLQHKLVPKFSTSERRREARSWSSRNRTQTGGGSLRASEQLTALEDVFPWNGGT